MDSFEFSLKPLKNPILPKRRHSFHSVYIPKDRTSYVRNVRNFGWFEFFRKVSIFMIGKVQIFRKCKKLDIEISISYTLGAIPANVVVIYTDVKRNAKERFNQDKR